MQIIFNPIVYILYNEICFKEIAKYFPNINDIKSIDLDKSKMSTFLKFMSNFLFRDDLNDVNSSQYITNYLNFIIELNRL